MLNSELNLPRLSYQECAEKAADDYPQGCRSVAYQLGQEYDGAATQGKNDLRINKIMALGLSGQGLISGLPAPLMKDGAQVGATKNGKTIRL